MKFRASKNVKTTIDKHSHSVSEDFQDNWFMKNIEFISRNILWFFLERIQEEQEQKEKERIEAALEKARDREEKLSSVKAAEQEMKEKRQEKLQQKQEYAAKRHQEQLASIRVKAFESTVQRYSTDEAASSSSMPPILQPYLPRKKCEICKVIIHNEVQLQSHLRGKKHKDQVHSHNS